MSSQPLRDRPLRADAERNRVRILEAAADLFAERGLDVPMDDIAAAACVGIGTVYRRFPDRDTLIDELFRDKIRDVERVALDALRIADPWDAFASFMRAVSGLHARDRGLKEALFSDHRGSERAKLARETIAPLGDMLLQRAQQAGVVRPDVVGADVPLLHFAIGFIADKTRDASPDAWERMLAIVLDGLRTQPDAGLTPMTTAPVGLEALSKAITGGAGPAQT
jgi:AcrR family transcriptional regulator